MVEKGSPAEKAGVKFGDEVVSINNEAVKSSQAWSRLYKRTVKINIKNKARQRRYYSQSNAWCYQDR